MASVCFYFQVHQPFRIRRYSVFDSDPFYFDNEANRIICEKVADKCYRPATRVLLDLVMASEGVPPLDVGRCLLCRHRFSVASLVWRKPTRT